MPFVFKSQTMLKNKNKEPAYCISPLECSTVIPDNRKQEWQLWLPVGIHELICSHCHPASTYYYWFLLQVGTGKRRRRREEIQIANNRNNTKQISLPIYKFKHTTLWFQTIMSTNEPNVHDPRLHPFPLTPPIPSSTLNVPGEMSCYPPWSLVGCGLSTTAFFTIFSSNS